MSTPVYIPVLVDWMALLGVSNVFVLCLSFTSAYFSLSLSFVAAAVLVPLPSALSFVVILWS